jgi:hypothetical protein
MGVEQDRIAAIGLNGDDYAGDGIRIFGYFPEELGEGFVEALAEQTQELAVVLEIDAEHFGDGNDILAVRDLFEQLGLDAFGESDDSLLMAGWAEVPSFA